MNKQELFEKYSINETHAEWDNHIDNWISVEIFRIMHDGKLPDKNDLSVKYITDFLDKLKDVEFIKKLRTERKDFGSLYLTAKRLVYDLSEQILTEINK